jgi:hypothetical protein
MTHHIMRVVLLMMVLFGVMLTLTGIFGMLWGLWYVASPINPYWEFAVIGFIVLVIGAALLIGAIIKERREKVVS